MDQKRKSILKKHGFNAKTKWADLPISEKTTIMNHNPKNGFSELRITSGSTGDPLFVFYSDKSVKAFIRRTVESLKKSDIQKTDIVLNLFAYGNYVPGSMYEKACQKMDVPVLPLGAPNTYPKEKIIDCIKRIKPTVWFSVPSYALGLLSMLEKNDNDLMPRKVIVAGESLLDSYVNKFKEFGVDIVNHFGLTECPAIGVSSDHNPKIINVIGDGIFIESKKVDGKKHLLVTDLYNDSTPVIRYDTKDIIEELVTDSNGFIKQFKLIGRDGEFIKLQGILVSKVKIINSILKHTDNFHIEIKIKNDRDVVIVYLDGNLRDNHDDIMRDLEFLHCKKEIIFKDDYIMPKTISNKAKYINDIRK